jgi:hypothetical protein
MNVYGRPRVKPLPTREQLYQDYLIDRLPRSVLREKWGSYHKLVKRFGIPLRGYPVKDIQKKPFSPEQLQIVRGTVLGDGYLTIPTGCRWPVLSIEHSITQEGYVVWLKEKLDPFTGKLERCAARPNVYKGRTIMGKGSVRFRTCAHPDLLPIYEACYPDGIRHITQTHLDHMNVRALAVLFMDDGCNSDIEKGICFSTGEHPIEEQRLLSEWIFSMYGLRNHIRHQNENGYRITFYGDNARGLLSLIEPYIAPSMLYKLHKGG